MKIILLSDAHRQQNSEDSVKVTQAAFSNGVRAKGTGLTSRDTIKKIILNINLVNKLKIFFLVTVLSTNNVILHLR